MEATRLKRMGVLYGAVLILFTAYLLLDTFVIPRSYAPVSTETAEPLPDSAFETEEDLSEFDYHDAHIRVKLSEYREYDTDIYVAEVFLSSAEYLKAGFAKNTYGKNVKQTVSEMAEASGAILAINGDYYGSRETGYVLRNGILYRDKRDKTCTDLVITEDGDFVFLPEKDNPAATLTEMGAWQAFSFGPPLVENGEVTVGRHDEVLHALASNPRTGIGIVEPLHYFFVVSDGRTKESAGLSLYQFGCFMQSLGVSAAYNMDGGGSSTLVFLDEVLNVPTSDGVSIEERSVSDFVYIGY